MREARPRLEKLLRGIPALIEAESSFGHDAAYWMNGKEIAHFESDDILDVRLTRSLISAMRTELKSDPAVALRKSGSDWLAVKLRDAAAVDRAAQLVSLAADAHRPAPGTTAAPPPSAVDLALRRRFH